MSVAWKYREHCSVHTPSPGRACTKKEKKKTRPHDWSVRKLNVFVPLVVCNHLAPTLLARSEPGGVTTHPPTRTCLSQSRISFCILALKLSWDISVILKPLNFQNAGQLESASALRDQDYLAAHFASSGKYAERRGLCLRSCLANATEEQ